jgi:glycosyltransferase involved in cell wall biosynthesis
MSGLIKTSIIIPTYNPLKNLTIIFRSLKNQKNVNFKNIEFLIVQNNKYYFSEVIPSFLIKNNFKCKIIHEPQLGLHYARNAGIKMAQSNNLILLDDDIKLANTHLSNMIKSLRYYNLVGGPNLLDKKIKILNWIRKFYFKKLSENQYYCPYLSYLDLGNKNKAIKPNFIFGMNMGFKRKLFYKLNGFHPDLIGRGYDNIFIGDGETGFLNKCAKNNTIAFYNYKCKVFHELPAKRLTKSYFIERSKYHAFNDSFSILRDNKSSIFVILRLFKKVLKFLYLNIKLIFFAKKSNKLYFNYKLPMEIQYIKSFIKHHFLFIFDKKLNSWVKKEKYF